MERVTELTRSPRATRSSSSAPFADAGVLDGDVVVDDHGADADVLGLGELPAHVEGHTVAGVVVDDVEHALLAVHELARLVHVVRRRRGEDIARAGRVEHARADRHDVRRLVPRAGALDDRDLVVARHVGAHDQVVCGHVLERLGVCGRDALQHLRHELLRVVHELLHGVPPQGARA